jgi:hypothetical protein
VARDEELHREVALKEIQASHDDLRSRSRFLLEAEVTGGLEHPGVVPVYGLGAYPDGRPFYAMRLIKGDSLKDRSDRVGIERRVRVGLAENVHTFLATILRPFQQRPEGAQKAYQGVRTHGFRHRQPWAGGGVYVPSDPAVRKKLGLTNCCC